MVNFVQKIVSDPIAAVQDVVETAKDVAKNAVDNITKPTKEPANETVAKINEVSKNIIDSVKETTKKAVDVAVGVAKAVQGEVKEAALSTTKESNKIVSLLKTEGTKRIYQMGNGETETRTGGTVAWRNNNPGNLKFEFKGSADKTVKSKRTKDKALSDAQKRYAGVVALDQWGNAVFETMEAGAIAKAKLLKKQHGDKTFQQMLRGYAVDDYSGKTNYKAYEATINKTAAAKGVSLKGKKIGEMSQAEFAALAEGMVKAEGLKEGKISRTGITTTQNKTPQGAKALASFAQNADVPNGNPHKSQVNNSSNMTASNVTIHQSFTTDMTINGAREPIESANAVKRQQENQLAFMARNAMSPLAG